MTRQFIDRAIGVLALLALVSIIGGTIMYARLLITVNQLRRETAEMSSTQSITETAIDDLQYGVKSDDENIVQACGFAAVLQKENLYRSLPASQQTEFLDAVWNMCPNTPHSHIKEERAFQDAYWPAVVHRVRQEFVPAADGFAEALATPGVNNIAPDWQARALEGRGYALMRLGRLTEAKPYVNKATSISRELPGGFVFADLTDIKLKCEQRAQIETIRAELQALRKRFDGLKSNPSISESGKMYAAEDRLSIERDGELFILCQYAGVQPQTLKS